ncbi:uncharacterized protein LOC141855004 [Brevipalpus obovatus]|uniref:uncharacterized protein LOC141855004 n=1 Tax=Brevipalpus obovatus TaxID=246614 RepID=UPI003D9EF83C
MCKMVSFSCELIFNHSWAMIITVFLLIIFGKSSFQEFVAPRRCPMLSRYAHPVNPEKYKGKWYTIERIPNTYEIDTRCSMTNHHFFRDEFFFVENIGCSKWNVRRVLSGIGSLFDRSSGLMRIHYDFTRPKDHTYWIVATDYDSYSVVVSCRSGLFGMTHHESIWIHSRKPSLDPNTLHALHRRLKQIGFHPDHLEKVSHQGCPEAILGSFECKPKSPSKPHEDFSPSMLLSMMKPPNKDTVALQQVPDISSENQMASATISSPTLRPKKKRPSISTTSKPITQRPSLQDLQNLQAMLGQHNLHPVIQSSIQMQVTSHLKLPTRSPIANTAGIWLDIDCPLTTLSHSNQSGMFPSRCEATVMRNEHQPMSLLGNSEFSKLSSHKFDSKNDSQELSESITNETKT